MTLPQKMIAIANLRGAEYGWHIDLFPSALDLALQHSLACLGGQFQFRLPNGSTYEMYWLSADSTERKVDESWHNYVARSIAEVRREFNTICDRSDFEKQGREWNVVREMIDLKNASPLEWLYFVAYFVEAAY